MQNIALTNPIRIVFSPHTSECVVYTRVHALSMCAVKSRPTCNLAELCHRRHCHWYCWLQSEQEAGRQRLIWHLIHRQEHRITATGHGYTILTALTLTFPLTQTGQINSFLMRELKQHHITPVDPAVGAVGSQRPSEAGESRR